MASKNKVNLLGHLGRDPELRYTPSGKQFVIVDLATTESWKDKESGERQEHTEWHRLVFFNKLAEITAEYLCKGSLIDIEGKLRTRKWTDKDGLQRYSTEVIVQELQMLGGKRKEGGPQGNVGESDPADDIDDIPF